MLGSIFHEDPSACLCLTPYSFHLACIWILYVAWSCKSLSLIQGSWLVLDIGMSEFSQPPDMICIQLQPDIYSSHLVKISWLICYPAVRKLLFCRVGTESWSFCEYPGFLGRKCKRELFIREHSFLQASLLWICCACGSFFFSFFLIRLISFSLSEYYHFNLLGVSFELTRFQSQISRPIWFSEVQTEKIYCKYMFFINEFLLYGWL